MSASLSESSRRPRILLAKPGMDGHNRGVRVVARALSDAGCEVIYLGVRRTPGEIVAAAVEEDVDVVGLSVLSGAHVGLCREVRERLDAADARDVILVCGGIIPDDDQPELFANGVRAVFTPGASLASIKTSIWQLALERRAQMVHADGS